MEWLDKPLGPMRLRAWGLVANMIANAIALYGLAQFLRDGSGLMPLGMGIAATVALVALLAVPAK